MSRPRNIHIASRTLQRNWSVDDRVWCVDARSGTAGLKRVEKVATRWDWWGKSAKLATSVEGTLGRFETDATPLLRHPEKHWPVPQGLREMLAVFVAIHIVRTPAWRLWHQNQVFTRVAAAIEAEPRSEGVQMEVIRRLQSDAEVAAVALSHAVKLASLVASMHWSLLKFDRRMLALSDQPVSAVPLLAADGTAPIEVVPMTGFAEVIEIRLPLGPDAALVMTWYDHPEEAAPRTATYEHACSLNVSTIAQANRHWIRHPEGIAPQMRPPLLELIADPLAPQLLAGYDATSAAKSNRKRHAMHMVTDLIERQVADVVAWVHVGNAGVPG